MTPRKIRNRSDKVAICISLENYTPLAHLFQPHLGGRDPLADVVAEVHRVGIKVIPWFEYGFACSHLEDGGHILNTKPQWKVRMPNGTLLRSGGLTWMNAFNPEVQEFMHSLVVEVITNYNVDGIQGNDRLPAFLQAGLESPDIRLLA